MIYRFFIIIILSTGSLFSQINKAHINLIILIDDELINGVNILEGQIFFNKNKIAFQYETGDLLLNDKDLKIIQSTDQNTDVNIEFIYKKVYPEVYERQYVIKTKLHWINQRYSILKIYNYDNKKNRKYFLKNKGYDFEIFKPGQSKILPRKKRINQKNLLKIDH